MNVPFYLFLFFPFFPLPLPTAKAKCSLMMCAGMLSHGTSSRLHPSHMHFVDIFTPLRTSSLIPCVRKCFLIALGDSLRGYEHPFHWQ